MGNNGFGACIVCIRALLSICITPDVTSFKVNPEFQNWVGCLSHFESQRLLNKRVEAANKPMTYFTSIDLGLTSRDVMLNFEGLLCQSSSLKSGNDYEAWPLVATWEELESIVDKKNRNKCYALYDDGSKPWHISTVSKTTGNPASLCPPLYQGGAPTMLLGGFTMHRISGDSVNPTVDTSAKLSTVRISKDHMVLDTCMGLGYTAIGAAERLVGGRGKLTTIEFDDASVEMCAYNPWSQKLFDSSLPIHVTMGDACEIVQSFKDSSFDIVIHDPPARALCKKDLYGLSFYTQLFRVLKKSGAGELFHYIGNPKSKESGRLYSGIKKRLVEAGFQHIRNADEAFGLLAST